MGLFDRKKQDDKRREEANDQVVFTEECLELLKEHVDAVIAEGVGPRNELDQEDFRNNVKMLHYHLLTRFFVLAKSEAGLSKFMFPIMMYLRTARSKRQRALPDTK